jgi:hypothetical protein
VTTRLFFPLGTHNDSKVGESRLNGSGLLVSLYTLYQGNLLGYLRHLDGIGAAGSHPMSFHINLFFSHKPILGPCEAHQIWKSLGEIFVLNLSSGHLTAWRSTVLAVKDTQLANPSTIDLPRDFFVLLV